MPPRVNTVLQKQSREMLYHVFCFMKKEAEETGVPINLLQLYKRTANATNTSVTTVRRIVREGKITGGVFKTPGQQCPRKKPVTGLDNAAQNFIRTCIHELQTVKNEELSVEKLRRRLQDDINFQGSEMSLRRILKELGYVWIKMEHNKNKRILVEKPEFNDDQHNNSDEDDDEDSEDEVAVGGKTKACESSVTADDPIAAIAIKHELKEEPNEKFVEMELVEVKMERF